MMNSQMADTFYIYTDASFSKEHGIAVIGYTSFVNSREHETTLASEKSVFLSEIKESNNIRAEIQAVLAAIDSCAVGSSIVLFTDCMGIKNLSSRRRKLESQNFISRTKNKKLTNADLYQRFFSLCDSHNLDLRWVKGHSSDTSSRVQKNFSFLDKQVRRFLRKRVSLRREEAARHNILEGSKE